MLTDPSLLGLGLGLLPADQKLCRNAAGVTEYRTVKNSPHLHNALWYFRDTLYNGWPIYCDVMLMQSNSAFRVGVDLHFHRVHFRSSSDLTYWHMQHCNTAAAARN